MTAGIASTYATHATNTGLDATKTYQVFVSWVPSENNTKSARYLEWINNQWVNPRDVNQQIEPSDYVDANGVRWYRLSTFTGLSSYGMGVDAGQSVADGTANLVIDDGVLLMPMESSERTIYNKVGDPVQSIDALGNETISLYDRWGRLTSVYELADLIGDVRVRGSSEDLGAGELPEYYVQVSAQPPHGPRPKTIIVGPPTPPDPFAVPAVPPKPKKR